jgi:hypothetical protein
MHLARAPSQSTESPILFRSCGHETPFSDQKWASKNRGFSALHRVVPFGRRVADDCPKQSTESPILFRACEHETPFSGQKEASKIGDSVLWSQTKILERRKMCSRPFVSTFHTPNYSIWAGLLLVSRVERCNDLLSLFRNARWTDYE